MMYAPRDLAAELGDTNESRPRQVVRRYLRAKYPEHTGFWVLDEAQADDVRANVPHAS